MSEWYVLLRGKNNGPFTAKQLVALARNGKLRPEYQVKKGADGKWLKASSVKGLFESVVSSAPQRETEKPHEPHSHASNDTPKVSDELQKYKPRPLREAEDAPHEELQRTMRIVQIFALVLLMIIVLWIEVAERKARDASEASLSGTQMTSQIPKPPHVIILIAAFAALTAASTA